MEGNNSKMDLQDFSLDSLLLNKGLLPLSESDLDELNRVQSLDITNYTEADVREEVINTILKILGYRKGEFSSVDREKHISFADKTSKYIDYNLTLWESNFWLIEAKRPNLQRNRFGYKELRQAVEYAAHPQINAALVVLCDGCKLELFDREENVNEPVLRFPINQIVENFDKLRDLLAPINVWFFYKRRVIRAIDRAFEHEINQERVVEFQRIVDKRLNEKRLKILENFRSLELSKNGGLSNHFSTASIDEVVDIHFFLGQTKKDMEAMLNRLVINCLETSSFSVLHKVFPDSPRDVNDRFYMYALALLMQLEQANANINWLPSWLTDNENSSSFSLQASIRRLIRLCLTYFAEDESRKVILLASNTYQRIFKLRRIILAANIVITWTSCNKAMDRTCHNSNHSLHEKTLNQIEHI